MRNPYKVNNKYKVSKILAHACVFLLLALTAFAWYSAKTKNDIELQANINDVTNESTGLIKQKLDSYSYILYGLRSLFAASRTVGRSEWKEYVFNLKLERSYPGILSLEFTRLVKNKDKIDFEKAVRKDRSINGKGYPGFKISPPGNRGEYYVVDYIEPMEGSGILFGHDRGVSRSFRLAMNSVEDSGKIAVSEQIPLLRRNQEPGFVILLPIYEYGIERNSVKHGALTGFVSMTICLKDFLKDVLVSKYSGDFDLEIYEDRLDPDVTGGSLSPRSSTLQLLYDSDKVLRTKNGACGLGNCVTKIVNLPNRSWYLFFTILNKSRLAPRNLYPQLMAIMGISITMLVYLMIVIFNNSERRAGIIAEEMLVNLKEVNEKLHNLYRDWETTFNSMNDGIAILGKENEIINYNNAFMRILGGKKNKYIGLKCYEVFHNASEPILNCPFMKVKETRVTESLEMFEPALDKWLSITVSPVLDSKGELLKVVQVVRDITERKKMEDMMHEFTKEIFDLYNNAPFGYHSASADTTITRVNDTTVKWLGYSREEIVGKMKSADFLVPQSAKIIEELFPKLKKDGRLDNIELEMRRKDGSTFSVLGSSTVLKDKTGNFLMTRSSIIDITEYKKISEELKKAMETKSAFTSMVSHELRTPLTSIKEGLGIVLDGSAGAINEDQRRFLELTKRNVDRLNRLINNILDFTKLNSRKMKYIFKAENLNSLVKEIAEMYSPAMAKKGLYIKTVLAPEMPLVILDADKISQVINNLLNNAEKFTEEGGITVLTRYNSSLDQAVINIVDTGKGISKNDIGKLFKEFSTVGSQRVPGGTGLGLAICRQIVEGHSGDIFAESEGISGKGSEFTIVLPASRMGYSKGEMKPDA